MNIVKRLILILTGISLLYSCKLKDKEPIIGVETLNMESVPNVMNISKAMELNLDEALVFYGETTEGYGGVKDYEYILGGTNGINTGLGSIYTEKQIKSREILIKEVTWKMDSLYRLTIWYEKVDSGKYIPKHYHIWNINIEY